MAVYRPTKDSKVWWYDFVFEGQRIRESAKTRSKKVARDAERVRRHELEQSYNGIKRRDRARLFSLAADEWLVCKSLTLAPSSQRIERDNLKHLRPHFEKRLVTDIQAKDVSRYQQTRLAEGASPKTINLEVGTLRAILRRHRVWSEIQQDVRMLPCPVVASMMGWSAATAIRMAKRYGHIGNQALRDAADVLGGVKIAVDSLKKSPKSQEAESASVQ